MFKNSLCFFQYFTCRSSETVALNVNKWSKYCNDELTDSEKAFLNATGKFFLDRDFDVVSRYFLVLEESLAKLLVASGHEDGIELRFVGAPLFFA